ncbi:hypothetical protein OG21DRAFT_1514638 [Imleria badia]|nr:hypothetical protein OG21DRAFT_1514638 [Imleria badia]
MRHPTLRVVERPPSPSLIIPNDGRDPKVSPVFSLRHGGGVHRHPDQLRTVKAGDLILTATKPDNKPLFASYKLSQEQSAFFKAQTRIKDYEALKQHIVEVQARTYRVGLVSVPSRYK